MVLPKPLPELAAEEMMRRAIEVARTTPPDDVPVGAVLFDANGRELAHATNRRETDQDPTAHAEVLAIRSAVAKHGDGWRLSGCTLAVTLEPCTMCAGALLGARLKSLVFGSWEPKTGACGSLIDVLRVPAQLHRVEVRGGVLEQECATLLTDFFVSVRLDSSQRKGDHRV
ncbi:nucleoside deaminase [Corynebacterium sp. H128]|uniref:nucleoside deaminase n=1 Tax=Corynebacterium sp. H128 TaxID=3133427 RepID=UPI0030A1645E